MKDDDKKLFEHYVETWVRALQVFAGYPRSFVLERLQPLEHDVTHHPDVFFHEPAMYYLTELLVPPRLRPSSQVHDRVFAAIHNDDFSCDPGPDFDWEAAKDRVEQVLNEYGESLSSLRLNGGELKPED